QAKSVASTQSTRFCRLPWRSYAQAQSHARAAEFPASSHVCLPRSCRFLLFRARKIRMWIAHGAKVSRARARIQLAQQIVVPLLRAEFRNAVIRIVGVSKYNCFRWARLFASGDDFAVADTTARAILAFFFRRNSHIVDALHAVRALFHHASAADGHFRIPHQL